MPTPLIDVIGRGGNNTSNTLGNISSLLERVEKREAEKKQQEFENKLTQESADAENNYKQALTDAANFNTTQQRKANAREQLNRRAKEEGQQLSRLIQSQYVARRAVEAERMKQQREEASTNVIDKALEMALYNEEETTKKLKAYLNRLFNNENFYEYISHSPSYGDFFINSDRFELMRALEDPDEYGGLIHTLLGYKVNHEKRKEAERMEQLRNIEDMGIAQNKWRRRQARLEDKIEQDQRLQQAFIDSLFNGGEEGRGKEADDMSPEEIRGRNKSSVGVFYKNVLLRAGNNEVTKYFYNVLKLIDEMPDKEFDEEYPMYLKYLHEFLGDTFTNQHGQERNLSKQDNGVEYWTYAKEKLIKETGRGSVYSGIAYMLYTISKMVPMMSKGKYKTWRKDLKEFLKRPPTAEIPPPAQTTQE